MTLKRHIACIVTTAALAISATAAFPADKKLDTAKIEQITGMKGTYNEKENVFKVTTPRNDVQVSVDGWKMPPFMGLGPWAAFTPHHSGRSEERRVGKECR